MIHILTLKVDTKYSFEYVNKLYNSIKRNTTEDFNFYCYTEDSNGLHPEIKVVRLDNPDEFKLQWHKVKFHKINFANIPTGDKCLILDIDWIITGNMDDILNYNLPKGTFGCFERWWSNMRHACKINGGFQMFYMGDTHQLWTTFKKAPEHWQEYYIKMGLAEGPVNGEQNFIDPHLDLNRAWLPMEWFAKHHEPEYRKMQRNWHNEVNSTEPYFMGGEFCETIKMVHFSNANNQIHTVNEDWLNDYWY